MKTVRKFGLPLLAMVSLGFAVAQVMKAQSVAPPKPLPIAPAESPFGDTVAGSGIVEAQTENISVGSALAGIVTTVHVKVGQRVRAKDPLFEPDDRQMRAELELRKANLAAAEAQLAKLIAQPRPEELPAMEAKVREAQASMIDREGQFKRAQVLGKKGVMTSEELVTREQAYHAAEEQWKRAQSDYELMKAGAWKPDLDVARAAVEQNRAQLEQTETDIDRLVVRALVDGEVLQVNVRPGEFVGAPPGAALVVLGNVEELHVRADIDEYDIWRYNTEAPARAKLRGDPKQEFPLTFVRVEPFVVPKKSLTGDNTERVDTRVLQVIYAVKSEGQKLYVGQQLDIFVDAQAAAEKSVVPAVQAPRDDSGADSDRSELTPQLEAHRDSALSGT